MAPTPKNLKLPTCRLCFLLLVFTATLSLSASASTSPRQSICSSLTPAATCRTDDDDALSLTRLFRVRLFNVENSQVNNLQWILDLVPLIKALQMALSVLFWYYLNLQTCSLWMSSGVHVTALTGILFQTASFVSFMLISHDYCIMYDRLSITERRTTARLGCLLCLSLICFKAAIPYFTVFLLINYFASFYIIFRRTSQCLLVLREQLNLVEERGIHSLHGTLNRKYTMFKRFQGTLQVAAVVFIMVYMRVDDRPDNYWFHVLVREWGQLCIFMYIGWNFRIPEASLHLPETPLMKSNWEITVPPIYSVARMEMDAADFRGLVSDQWHVGVRTSHDNLCCSSQPLLVLVQNPSPKVSRAAIASDFS